MNSRSGTEPSSKAWLAVFAPLMYGEMPCSLTVSTTGPITNSDRNRASPISTWLGGTPWVPIALRVSDSTTTIFVNAVHSSSSDGATPITVTSTISWTTLLG